MATLIPLPVVGQQRSFYSFRSDTANGVQNLWERFRVTFGKNIKKHGIYLNTFSNLNKQQHSQHLIGAKLKVRSKHYNVIYEFRAFVTEKFSKLYRIHFSSFKFGPSSCIATPNYCFEKSARRKPVFGLKC